ncbi:MAG: polyphosphate polymerase domain-containing protein [Oscillospiraceae bacterium]|nr:polyphosphate polymerase domain-containing protein [Oscillospiraceae bacterium]
MAEQQYRHEIKHYINIADCMTLKSRLRHIASPDPNAGENGAYKIRSLYFDNYEDKAVTDKLSGVGKREKFRLRYYNDDPSFIRLEKKSKVNKGTYKEMAEVTAEQCEKIIGGSYLGLLSPESPLLSELYVKIQSQNLRPKMIVDYMREAYVYAAGNVRLTIDSDIRSSANTLGFLRADLPTIPSASAIILEIKYDGFLPDLIRDIVQIGSRHATEFSKYVVSRLI